MTQRHSICIYPRLEGLGGPASFRARLVAGLQKRGISIVQDPKDPACQALLVIGGTRHIIELVEARRRGIHIIQRLNGMNWVHRQRFTGVRHFLRSEVNNLILATIRRSLADRIVYQSEFSRAWWKKVHHDISIPSMVVYNGVDLIEFAPKEDVIPPRDRYTILLVEARLGDGYEQGLYNAADLAKALCLQMDRPVELLVVGSVPDRLRARLDATNPGQVIWKGVVRREEIAAIDRSAHVLFSGDVNAACPNSVIEALASGVPVVSFATGALPELVEGDAGLVVPWGSNFWKLEPPDIPGLAQATRQILSQQERYRKAARIQAERKFGLDLMIERYLDALFG